MTRVDGPAHDVVERHAGTFTRHTVADIRSTLRAVVAEFDRTPSVDDLSTLPRFWAVYVDDDLMPELERLYLNSAQAQRARLPLDALVAAPGDAPARRRAPEPTPVTPPQTTPLLVPSLSNPHAERYLAEARNRLVNVGNDVWEHARGALLDGMHAGEGVERLQIRVIESTDLAEPRASVIARTEVNAAENQGSIAQMRLIDVEGMTKGWSAVMDSRTRPTHREANGQQVPLSQPFIVGGDAWDVPGDVNCRCTVWFDLL